MELRDGSVVLEVELNNRDDVDSVTSDGCYDREMVTRLDVVVGALLSNGDASFSFTVDVGVEDEAFDTESILLAGLLDDLELEALVAVLCSQDFANEQEKLDKVDCTNELYDEEEELADVFCTDEGVVEEPLKEREWETTVDALFETRLECDRDEEMLCIDAEVDNALELLNAREIATSGSQTALRRNRQNILRNIKEGKLIDDKCHNC